MRKALLLAGGLLFAGIVAAQTGCPGCIVSLPDSLPVDTLYLPDLPDGEAGKPYNASLSFRMPITTTPVNAVDSVTPPGLTISEIEILDVEGLPAGLNWQPNQFVFDPGTQTDGCFRICGTPLQSDTFILTVRLRASVLFISQETSFPMTLYIAPPTSSNEGFTAENTLGCGATTVTFTNNVPSNGQQGYSYSWEFGDGSTFMGENPPPHYYGQPGQYIVNYVATIDTADHALIAVTVLSVTCDDQLGLGAPDLYMYIRDPNGDIVYNSGPDVTNVNLPYTFGLNFPLGPGNYTLEVFDEDTGLKGSDDPCGSVSFNILSNGTLVAGGFSVELAIEKPVSEIISTDTILVFPVPAVPDVEAPFGTRFCEGSDSLILVSNNGTANQWWLNGEPIDGALEFVYRPEVTGYYQVEALTPFGCSSISDSFLVVVDTPPAQPVFVNTNNLLSVADTNALPAVYSLQWLLFNSPIPGATGTTYCAITGGIYDLMVTDAETGCTSQYGLPVVFNPDFDCTTSAEDIIGSNAHMRIYPNPATSAVWVAASALAGPFTLQVWDAAGRLVYERDTQQLPLRIECENWQAGMYAVTLRDADTGTLLLGRFIR